jgi:hypothetical protein
MVAADYEFGAAGPMVPAPHQPAEQVPSVLGGLLDELADAIDEEAVTFAVESRPGWEVRYSVEVPYEQYAVWQTAAADPAMPGGLNELQLHCTALAACCQALRVKGEDVTEDGAPVTFHTPGLQRRLDVIRPADAVRKLYRFDGHVIATGRALLQAAGYGAGATPTKR